MRFRGKTIVFLAFLFLASFILSYGQIRVVGEISGIVVEEGGEGLPGVSVKITGAALQRESLSTLTDRSGRFMIPNLLPGSYELEFRLDGFTTVIQRNVSVYAGRSTPLRVVMSQAPLEQQVLVQAPPPLVEVKSPQRATNYTSELIQKLPVQRNIYDIVNMTPGFFENSALGAGGVTPQTVFWQGASNTAYRINGVDVSDTRLGVTSSSPIYETIEEIDVVTVGASAEYGNFTGATVNVITKSGSNQWHGSLAGFYTDSKLRGDNNTLGVDYRPSTIKYDMDFNATVSGPIFRDRLLFFLAAGYWGMKSRSYGVELWNTYYQPKYYAKLDWLVNPRHTFSISLSGNPAKNRLLDPGTNQPLQNGGDYLLQYNNIFASWRSTISANMITEIRYSGFIQNYKDWPAYPKDVPFVFDLVTGINYGYRYMIDRNSDRHEVDINFRYYFDNFLKGNHEIIFGLEYERSRDKEDSMRPGGAWIWRLRSPADTYQVRIGDTHTNVMVERLAIFIQDNISLFKRLTLNLGLRYDQPLMSAHRFQGEYPPLTSLSPRIGFSFDLAGDLKTIVRGSFGLYHNKVLTQSFTYGLPGKENEYNYRKALPGFVFTGTDEDILYIYDQVVAPENIYSVITYADPIPMAPETKLPGTRAYSAGISRQLFRTVTVDLDYIYKRDFNISTINDLTPHTYIPVEWTDPYLGKTVTLYQKTDSAAPNYVYANAKNAFRKHHFVTLSIRKRMDRRWSAMASVTYQDSRGNVDNDVSDLWGYPTYNFDTDPYYSDPFRYGKLGLNRHWQIKAVVSYLLPWQFTITGTVRWMSGLTWSPYLPGWVAWQYTLRPYGYLSIFLEPRGSRTGPSGWFANINVTKSFKLISGIRLDLIADVFNVFNTTYGVGIYTDPTGVYPVSGKSNFGQPNGLIDPVNLRLGAKIIF